MTLRCRKCGWQGDQAALLNGEACPRCKLLIASLLIQKLAYRQPRRHQKPD